MNHLFFSLIAILFSGCTKTIDASNDISMKQSIEKLTKDFTPEKKDLFQKSVMFLAMGDMSLMEMAKTDKQTLKKKMMENINGKTPDEVIAHVATLKEQKLLEREKKETEQAKSEIAELEQLRKTSEEHGNSLKKFKIKKSRFYKRKDGFIKQPIIELAVENGTDHPISRAYFEGTLATPGRSIPWLKEAFNYQIPGGLEPGEKTVWQLSPNMFSAWGKVDERKDMLLTVEVTKLDGPNKEQIYAYEWNEEKEERLNSLKRKFAD